MKKTLFLIVFTILSLSTHAQDEAAAFELNQEFNLWNFQRGDQAYVFADVAYIRDYPSLESKVIDSLAEGHQVVIRSEAYNGNTIRGFYAPWHEVTYTKDKKQAKGFIWLGLLAFNGSRNEAGELFIYGFKKYRTNNGYSPYYESELKVFNKKQEFLTKEIFHAEVNGQSAIETKILSGMGLENIQNIHRVSFLGEACGIPSRSYYFAWNGTNLIHFPEKMNVSDGGIFYHEETILFPSEHKGDPKMIYKNIIDAENISEDYENPTFIETKHQQEFTWDGRFLSEIIRMY